MTKRRLGNWTTARRFQVRAHRGHAVLDLRSPQIPAGDIEVEADLDHATLKLLVAATPWWTTGTCGSSAAAGSRDAERLGGPGGRRIVVTGQMRRGEIRVHRGGIAQLSAMFSREYWADLRRAHKEGAVPDRG